MKSVQIVVSQKLEIKVNKTKKQAEQNLNRKL